MKRPVIWGFAIILIPAVLCSAITIDPYEIAKLTASDPHAGDRFGLELAIDGDTMLIGAPADQDTGVERSGSVYVFQRQPDGTWAEQQEIHAPDPHPGYFGRALAIQGDTAMIGAWFDAPINPNNTSTTIREAGSAYVYERQQNGTWQFRQKLISPNPHVAERFGVSLDFDGDTALIGANQTQINNTWTGAVWEFTRQPDGNWTSTTNDIIHAEPVVANLKFGAGVSMHGDIALIGNGKATYGGKELAGLVRVYQKQANGSWTLEHIFTDDVVIENAQFGSRTQFDGQYALIGSAESDGLGGTVRTISIYRMDAIDNWVKLAEIGHDNATELGFGPSFAMQDHYLYAGLTLDSLTEMYPPDGLESAGSVLIYDLNGEPPIPEPATFAALCVAVLGLGRYARKRNS